MAAVALASGASKIVMVRTVDGALALREAGIGQICTPGVGSRFPGRPKGMHRETYQRLGSELRNAEMLAKAQFGIALGRVLQHELQLEEGRMERMRSAA
jgi:hypothetical protein